MTLPKSWTGLEEKPDGTLVYNERGALSILTGKKKSYVIDRSIYNILKNLTLLELLLAVSLLVYLKLQNFSLGTVVLCFILFLVLDSIVGALKNQFVSRKSKKEYNNKIS